MQYIRGQYRQSTNLSYLADVVVKNDEEKQVNINLLFNKLETGLLYECLLTLFKIYIYINTSKSITSI